MVIPKESQVASYYAIREQLDQLGKQFQTYITKPAYLVPYLQPGRLIKVRWKRFWPEASANLILEPS